MTKLLWPKKPEIITPSKPVLLRPEPAELVARPGTIDRVWDSAAMAKFREWQLAFRQKFGVWPIKGGTAGSWTFTNNSRTHFLDGTFAFGTDTFKLALFQSTSNIGASSDLYSGLTNEVASANGYTTGGVSVTMSLSGTTTVTLAFTQAQWTASGGSITARFGVLYEVSGKVVAYFLCDNTPADVTATSGNTFTVAAGNVFSLA